MREIDDDNSYIYILRDFLEEDDIDGLKTFIRDYEYDSLSYDNFMFNLKELLDDDNMVEIENLISTYDYDEDELDFDSDDDDYEERLYSRRNGNFVVEDNLTTDNSISLEFNSISDDDTKIDDQL